MRESLTNIKRKRVNHTKNHKFLKYLLGLFVFGLIAASAYVAIRSVFAKESFEVRAEPDRELSLEKLTDPAQFKKVYIEKNGGLEHLQNLQSLRIAGRIATNEQEIEFVGIKRRPDMMLLTQWLGQAKVTYGSQGGQFWKRESVPGQKETVKDVGDDRMGVLAEAVEMFGPILTAYLKGTNRIESIEQSQWEGSKALRIKLLNADESSFDFFYVDPVRMEVVAQVANRSEGQDMVSEFSDYKTVNRVNIPFTTIVKQGDEVLSRVVLEDARFNIGASSILFKR